MLNKEMLLLVTGGQTERNIKLTVGSQADSFGYSNEPQMGNSGSVSKVPCWNVNGKPSAMIALFCEDEISYLMLQGFKPADDIPEFTVAVVEKGSTVTLVRDGIFGYSTKVGTGIFNSSDVGKTFTIVFDPEPTGYV